MSESLSPIKTPSNPPPLVAPGSESNSKEALADYLRDNDWEKELNYKMWVTKGARFCAAKRLEATSHASVKAQTFLSAYLIILGLVPAFLPAMNKTFSPEWMGLSSAGISILMLAYNQLESSRNYQLRAHRHHECALRIGRYYNALRAVKRIENADERRAEVQRVTKKYERALAAFENHDDIDFAVFQAQKPDYFKLGWWARTKTKLSAYHETKFRYHLLIILPPIAVGLLYSGGSLLHAAKGP